MIIFTCFRVLFAPLGNTVVTLACVSLSSCAVGKKYEADRKVKIQRHVQHF